MNSYNIKFPLVDDNSTNTFFQTGKITKESFSSDLLLLLLTQKGERYYESDYGTDLLKYIFEPNDELTMNDIETEIKKTVSTYIPYLKIKKVSFNRTINDSTIPENQLNVNIKFTYEEDTFTEEGEIDLNF